MTGKWVEPDVRDEVVSTIEKISSESHLTVEKLVSMVGICRAKYYNWKKRFGTENHHNGKMPKKHWLTPEEREAIVNYAQDKTGDGSYFVRDGYRRLTYMMIDEDIVYCSPASVYRVLKKHGLLNRWNTKKKSGKGNGYYQPEKPHQEWHTDIKYVNFKGTFLFFIGILDGYSRYIIHFELRTSMTEKDIEITIQRAKEKYPDEKPRIITDNGRQFLANDFKEFIKHAGFTHTRTSVAYPQSNGKIERFHRSLEDECIRRNSMISMKDALKTMQEYVDQYNKTRLHSSLYYLTPEDYMEGRVDERLKVRETKLSDAVEKRIKYWQDKKNVAKNKWKD